MSNRTFLVVDGQQFELVSFGIGNHTELQEAGAMLLKPIRPIKAIEKKGHVLVFRKLSQTTGNLIYEKYELTELTAQRVAEAVKALMDYLPMKIDGGVPTTQANNKMVQAIQKARKAFQRENA